MAAAVLYTDLIFAIITPHLTERGDLLAWRGLCRDIEPNVTKCLLACTDRISIRSDEDITTFHSMLFRGGSHRGRLAGFTGHVELSVGHIPQTHLQLVLDIFEHAQGTTSMSVPDFDTTLSSFLLRVPSAAAAAAAAMANWNTRPSCQNETSDVLARRLLACWARNCSLTKFSIDYRFVPGQPSPPAPCQWRSDPILEKERFSSVLDLTVHLGSKPIGMCCGGWQAAFPRIMNLSLEFGDNKAALGVRLRVRYPRRPSVLTVHYRVWQGRDLQVIRVQATSRVEDHAPERDLAGAEGQGNGEEEEAAAQTDGNEYEETGGNGELSQAEIEVEEALEREDDHKTGKSAPRILLQRGRGNH